MKEIASSVASSELCSAHVKLQGWGRAVSVSPVAYIRWMNHVGTCKRVASIIGELTVKIEALVLEPRARSLSDSKEREV